MSLSFQDRLSEVSQRPTEAGFPRQIEVLRVAPSAEPLSLGRTIADLHGWTGPVVSVGNWIPGPLLAPQDGSVVPFHVPDPSADAYLNFLNVAALRPGESALSFRLMPGLRSHYERLGILHAGAEIYEVDPVVRESAPTGDSNAAHLLGYPHTDILTLAVAQGVRVPENTGLAVTFPTPFVEQQAAELGAKLIQGSDATQTNNKALFRAAAERYGYPIFPGFEVHSIAELLALSAPLQAAFVSGDREARMIIGAERTNTEVRRSARLKDPRSSGGDGVKAVDGFATERALLRAYQELREGIVQALELNGAGETAHRWPTSDHSARFPYPLVVEQDARTIGEELFNGSFMVQIDHRGTYSVPHLFGQRTDRDGSFRGGYSVDPKSPRWASVFTPEVLHSLNQAIDGVVRYWYGELGVRGLAGVDFMVLRRYDTGRHEIFLFDPNVRPTINSISCVVAEKVARQYGYTAWTNINGWATTPLQSIEDFRALLDLGEHGNFFEGCAEGVVVPIAARSLFVEGSCVRPSNVAKFLVAADSDESVTRILELLAKHRGLRYSSEEQ